MSKRPQKVAKPKLPTGWKEVLLPSCNVIGYRNTEFKLLEFSLDRIHDPAYVYGPKPEKMGIKSAYQHFLNTAKDGKTPMREIAGRWKTMTEEEKAPYKAMEDAAKGVAKAVEGDAQA